MDNNGNTIDVDELLSRPSAADVEFAQRLDGDVLILGAGGKMGPTLARLVRRASTEAGSQRQVYGVSRFSDAEARRALDEAGIATIACDVGERKELAELPDCPNILYLVGRKFGSSGSPHLTWATNVYAAALAAERYRSSRIVALSTANVYPFSDPTGGGLRETDDLAPVGEYAQTALGRERIFEYSSERHQTPAALLRLSYAIDLRYGVLRDLADKIVAGTPIDLTTGWANVIWQRDANSVIFRALEHCTCPPNSFNLSAGPALRVREAAQAMARTLEAEARFEGSESESALLVNVDKCDQAFGKPQMSLEQMIELTAAWVTAGGKSLGKPTHYEERTGSF